MRRLNLTNHLLIATPDAEDNIFTQGVVYICQHDKEGAMGILLNQPLWQFKFKEVLAQMKIEVKDPTAEDTILFAGGPVQPDHGFVIHSPVGKWKTSLNVTPTVAVTTSKDILAALAEGNAAPEKAIFALGYAGWEPEQLEKEVMENQWFVLPASEELLFSSNPEQLWKTALASSGVHDIATLAHFAGHA